MKIDFNELECKAMEAFNAGNGEEGQRLQGQFLEQVKESIKNGEDYCPCKAECSIHGNCFKCVQVHRGHGSHLPFCMQLMLNKKLEALSSLTEHTITDIVKKPDYLK